jgi:hypothetical protein
VEVAWWRENQEATRREFTIAFPAEGEYELRFNFVSEEEVRFIGENTWNLKKSTLEVLREP